MFSGPFRKHGVVRLAAYMQIYKKGDAADMKGWALLKKDCPTNVTSTKLEECTMLPSRLLAGIV